ncbi:type III-A CRISPR-associated RAMP protein Csm4 [Thermodesulforhabdus norvegica]|uniref:CRISPR system Cms protein Csm4 n=1 Tax=Thermodesulforhabdus norvegica TaxID=39841 RepID=A0A1I4TB97_9BACT|nr:type III-A CRISPR-associated RAMP protein Csm4 [Thermodesulforhabdus norvegica]SFM73992.1 CRISPR-associated protein Csm4 [Thermodesulforhabdus norvegica]
MRMYIYHLEFPEGVHFGRHGIGLEESNEVLPSDSLTSAVINAFAVLGLADEVIGKLREDPPGFVLSSLFPFGSVPDGGAEGSRRAYALPKPMSDPVLSEDGAEFMAEQGKDIKKLRYLEPADVVRWLSGEPLTEAELSAMRERGSGLAQTAGDGQYGWFLRELRPRVALDRASANSSIWMCGLVRFVKGAGLYGLALLKDDTDLQALEAAFRLLGDMGLGGERTYGPGEFRFGGFKPLEEVWPEVTAVKEVTGFELLSRFYPGDNEVSLLSSCLLAWDIEENRGFVSSGRQATTVKRKRLYFIKEGAVASVPLRGSMVDVTPDAAAAIGIPHRVYRCGLGFWFPMGNLQKV